MICKKKFGLLNNFDVSRIKRIDTTKDSVDRTRTIRHEKTVHMVEGFTQIKGDGLGRIET